MPDTLTLHEITVECRIGVEEWERAIPQPVWVDLELSIDAAKAARRDDVRSAVDYGRVVAAVIETARGESYQLIETLAEAIASRMLSEFALPRVRVRVRKKALPGLGYAAVEIERAAVRRRARRPARASAG
ncbi:MAG: dihydroneopterin aldolase [Candidatus Omnitrophica bacterium]|nr:dihydroneopterin aldolase [Candidatus Omnitrophota bacterium]